MNEAEKNNHEFDDKIIIDKSSCYFCKSELNADNTSLYRLTYKENGKTSISCLCVMCREVFLRLQNFESENRVPEIELKIRKKIYLEGWTNEMLKAKEEREFNTIQ